MTSPPSNKDRRSPDELRSARWFQPDDLRSFGHRSRLKGMGWADDDYRDKPVIGILNTWSDLNTCLPFDSALKKSSEGFGKRVDSRLKSLSCRWVRC